MRRRRIFRIALFHTGRGGRILPLAVALTLAAAATAFGQAPADSMAQSPDDQQTDTSSQSGSQTKSTTNDQGAQPPQRPAAQNDKSRLAVNPVTGLAASTATNFSPLTGEERWKLYWKQNFWSVGAYFGPVFAALVLDQSTDSPSQWGTGASGYGRRLASRTGSAIIQGTVQAPLAAVLHEDVRYISLDHGGFKRRWWHSVKYSFLTFNNQGRPTLNVANLTSFYASTAISTTWLPGRRNVLSYTFSNGSEQIGLTLPVNTLQEFWPEITRKVFHRH